MKLRRLLCLSALCLAFGFSQAPLAAQYPACDQIDCHLPPTAACDQPCWTCLEGGGIEYPGDTCDHPTLVTVAYAGCPCIQSTLPDFLKEQKPGEAPASPAVPGTPAICSPEQTPTTGGLSTAPPQSLKPRHALAGKERTR